MPVVFGETEVPVIRPDPGLYGRVCVLTVGAQRWTDLRVTFKIEKSSSKHTNNAEIVIYNLSPTSRMGIVQRGTPVSLVAGYTDTAAIIYVGELVEPTHTRDGSDWTTKLVCRTGDAAWYRYTSRAYTGSVPRVQVLNDLAASMGYSVPTAGAALVSDHGVLGAGIVTHGHVHEEMDYLLRPLGLEWSIQDGELQIVAMNTGTREPAVLLNATSGLIGTPEPQEAYHFTATRGKPKGIKAKSLLQPAIRPGRLVKIESESATGVYVVNTATHIGDTHGNDWTTEFEARYIGEA
jgi:hypothetical protein